MCIAAFFCFYGSCAGIKLIYLYHGVGAGQISLELPLYLLAFLRHGEE